MNDDLGTVTALLAAGAKINAQTDAGITPLYAALTNKKSAAIARLLISKGANVNVVVHAAGETTPTATALHRASLIGDLDTVSALLSAGAKVNATATAYGIPLGTPLFWAAATGKVAVAELLIRKGADVNAKDGKGRTPLTVAKDPNISVSAENKEIVALLEQKGGKE